ncbi:zn2-c6 fungal-type dna-binding domain protein [Fusarium sporotrichioides]|uniref:Zn2-c6 fungal-type dna-binding domain protein n=1 Tax=Fusarium sporotrichioides TaxID=5514 RepID=A0A395RLY9_FUSSP|nr:zn2-c6 fungal-type dna-binding domain protein [Fusarium sporotrichioides]
MSEGLHPKPMRLGTRSCAACRKRKVRCVFPAERPPCQQCILRRIPCTSQQPAASEIESLVGPSSLADERLNQRLADIERNVRDIWARLSPTDTSPSLTEILPGGLSTTSSMESHAGTDMVSMAGVENATHATTPNDSSSTDKAFGFQDAPLLTLMKAASVTEALKFSSSEPTIGNKASGTVHSPEFLMLQGDDLLMVLAATEQYWPTWPPWQYGVLPPNLPALQASGVKHAAQFLSRMARSSSPFIAAKVCLWLSLCIQQAPKTLQLSRCELSQEALLALYIQTANELLASGASMAETLDGIEARLIQQKIYLDMGRPRQAWLIVRRATDEALLLRLHQATEEKAGGREAAVWNQIWHLETTIALILGLPSSIPIPDYNDSGSSGYSPLRMLQYRMQSLAASIIARNQSQRPSYLVTMQISHKLDACRALMPDSWWREPPQQDQPFTQLYIQQAMKVQYFLITKMLHLPFMLNADAGYEYSRVSAVNASRSLIAAYLGLRNCRRGLFVTCESLDFQAFSAGITMLIRLLSLTPGERSINDNNNDEDWPLLEALTVCLRRTTSVMQCHVAKQAAEVLGLLSQAARGTYDGPERYAVVLPYLGKVTITLSQGLKPTDPEGLDQRQESQQQHMKPPFGTVELSANLFDIGYSAGSLEGELGGDWSSMADVDFSFDWTQTFTFNNYNN